MKLRVASDIHNEFKPWDISISENDMENTLIIAGDIHPKAKSISWLKQISKSFKNIILVLGNHDYWNDSFEKAVPRLKSAIHGENLKNVYVLDKESLILTDENGPVRFIGCTFWTNFNNGDSHTMWDATQNIKDYKKIRTHGGSKALSSWYIMDAHIKDKDFIERELYKPFDGKTIVITHHAPSLESIPPEFQDPSKYYLNGSYASNLHEWISDKPFHLWVHGHTHYSNDYGFGSGRVISNPRGYAPSDLNDDFIENLVIDTCTLELKQTDNKTYEDWWNTCQM